MNKQTITDYQDVINAVRNNSQTFSMFKAFEELSEFQEVLTKLQTKKADKRPPLNEALKEYGDVVYRGFFALLSLVPDEVDATALALEVEAHIAYKLQKLRGYAAEGKYKGGL